MYSNSAMPQLTRIATMSGFARRSRRCAYHANVMKTFEQINSAADVAIVVKFTLLLTSIDRCRPRNRTILGHASIRAKRLPSGVPPRRGRPRRRRHAVHRSAGNATLRARQYDDGWASSARRWQIQRRDEALVADLDHVHVMLFAFYNCVSEGSRLSAVDVEQRSVTVRGDRRREEGDGIRDFSRVSKSRDTGRFCHLRFGL